MAVTLWFVAAGAVLLVELHSGTGAPACHRVCRRIGRRDGVARCRCHRAESRGCGDRRYRRLLRGTRRAQAPGEAHNRPTITGEVGQSVVVVKPGVTPRVSWRGSERDAVLADGSSAAIEDRLRIHRQEGIAS